MRTLLRTLVAMCGLLLAAASVPAEEQIDVDAQVAEMREASRKLTALAGEPLPAFESSQEREEAEAYLTFLARAANDLDALASEWERERVSDRSSTAAGGGAESAPTSATRQLWAVNLSFNSQYLGLQEKLQDENSRFTLLSNVMKTKHDTAKNAISTGR